MNFFLITRPLNCLFVMITVAFGALYRTDNYSVYPLLFAVLSAAFIAAAGYVINDFFDLPIDSINKPKRILPSKKIMPKTAYLYSVCLFILGILLSFLTQNVFNILLAIINSIVLFQYAKIFKLRLLSGNLIVAYSSASTFIYGGLVNSNFRNSLIIAIFAFLYTLGREIVKDMEDIKGDKYFGANTIPLKFGIKKTIRISLIPLILLILYTFYLLFDNSITAVTTVILFFMVIVPLIFFFWIMQKQASKSVFSRISSLMKLDMFILLIIVGLDI